MTPPRRSPETRVVFSLVGLVLTSTAIALAGPPNEAVDFNRDIQPILSDHCYACHGPDPKARKAKLRLDTRDGALRTDDPVIVPGQSGVSELIRRVISDDPDEVMPPPRSKRRPTPAQIDLLKRWVDQGAQWGQHWAYVPPRRPALPRMSLSSWPANPVDHFVLARLQREGLSPSPEAPKEALIRRVTLDLTGLPPTPEQVAAFVADTSPDAYVRVVDRLLASPHYGERLAWDWLDAARYADSNGYQGDPERTMWPWRDWVVAAFNDNLPYDRFTVEQLAGDLLPGATPAQRLATGFNRNHMINGEGGRIAEETRIENVVDRVNTTATVWLGLTLGCAQCHDHKFDPFTQREYYQLFAYFNNTSEDGIGRGGQAKPVLDVATPEETARLADLRRRVKDLGTSVLTREKELFSAHRSEAGDPPTAGLTDAQRAELKRPPDQRTSDVLRQFGRHFQKRDPDYAALLGRLAAALDERNRIDRSLPRVMVMDELTPRRETFILIRGAYNKPGAKVKVGVPASLPPLPPDAPPNRLGLAQWLVSPANPLTARVTVNRVWQALFGTGLVKTAEDFGVQGEPPSHPELLDWLATEFVRTGWDLKALYRLLVTSATYRQASRTTAALRERDPENRLLARGPRYRLPSWMIRDQALAVSGLLVGRLGGPPVKPYQPEGVWEEATFGKKTYQPDTGEALYRRSLYTFWRRIIGPTMFFDNSARQTCSVRSARTNTPLHALTTLNDTTYVEAARVLAQRVLERGGASPRERLETAFRSVTARGPTSEEARLLAGDLQRVRSHYAADRGAAERLLRVGAAPRPTHLDPVEHAAYTAVCLLLLNLDETLTRQ
jgi:hypothetical protein